MATASTASSSTNLVSPEQMGLKIQAAQMKQEALYDLINTASQEIVDAQTARDQFIPGTSDTPESLRVKRVADLESQQRIGKIKESADFNNLSILLGQDLAAMAHQQRGLSQKIATDSAVSLFQDPALALANAFTLPWDQAALEGVTQKIATTTTAMNAVNNHVQQSAKTEEATKQSITAATLASETAAVENLFAVKSATARIESAKLRGAEVDAILKMDAQSVDNYMRKQQLADNAESRALQKKQFDRQMSLLNMQIAQVKKVEDAEATQMSLVNAALAAEGKNPLSMNGFKLYKASSAELVDALSRKGLELAMGGRDGYSHGPTIESRAKFENIIAWQPDPNKPQQGTIKQWELQSVNSASLATKDKKLAGKNSDAIFNDTWDRQQSDITEGSPFRITTPVIFSGSAEVIKHPIYQKYVVPTLTEANANNPLNEMTIIEAAGRAIADRTATSAEAGAFIATVFNQAAALNNVVLDFEKIAARKQTRYGYTPNISLIGNKAVNLMDSTEATAVAQRVATMIVIKNVAASGGLGGGIR